MPDKRRANKALQVKRGQDAIQRVQQHLLKNYNRIIVTKGKGTHGVPDLKIIWKNGRFCGCEVKRCQTAYQRGKDGYAHVGSIRIKREEWEGLLYWCQHNNAIAWLIVELYIIQSKKGHIYFRIDEDIITRRFNHSNVQYLTLTMWNIIRLGEKI